MWLLTKFENSIFFIYFFNKDISVNIPSIFLIFFIHADEGHLEGSVSQNFDLGPNFDFRQSRKKVLKNDQKLPVF